MSDKPTHYKLHELSQRAQDHALEDWSRNVDFDGDYVKQDAVAQGVERGFMIEDIRYSGFCSQGDGASWQGHIRLVPFLDYHLKEDDPDHSRYVVLREIINDQWVDPDTAVSYTGFMYSHSGCMHVDGFSFGPLDAAVRAVVADEDTQAYTLAADGPLQGACVCQLADAISYLDLIMRFDKWLASEARAYADKIYADLENAYDHEISYENFVRQCEDNDYLFDEDGNMI